MRPSKKMTFVALLVVFALHSSPGMASTPQISKSNNGQPATPEVNFVKIFFKWYKSHYEYLDHKIHPVDIARPYYKMNYLETEKYLSVLKGSGFFSKAYITSYRSYFKKIGQHLQKAKQNDGPVDGLDNDPILHTQEPEFYMSNLGQYVFKVEKLSGNSVIVKFKTNYDADVTWQWFYLTSTGNKYLIDKIETH